MATTKYLLLTLEYVTVWNRMHSCHHHFSQSYEFIIYLSYTFAFPKIKTNFRYPEPWSTRDRRIVSVVIAVGILSSHHCILLSLIIHMEACDSVNERSGAAKRLVGCCVLWWLTDPHVQKY